jgi:tetratricopeptide (TPR) repeat protein
VQDVVSSIGPVPAAARKARSRDGLHLAGLLAALVALGAAGSALSPALQGRGANGAAQDGATWEGRRLIAQVLWLKTHAVLHAGAEEREARPGEEISRADEIRSHERAEHQEGHADDHHGGEGHPEHVLAIPPKREDFRGVLGDLERAVKPYAARDGELYSKDIDQTVPFYRMMTWADPHMIQGYTVGASAICRAGKYADRALAFLKEGERANPDSPEIQEELGHYYLVYFHDYARAEACLRHSLALLPGNRKLTDSEEDARTDAYRWLALGFVQQGKPAAAIQAAREGIRQEPKDALLAGIIARQGRPMMRPGA